MIYDSNGQIIGVGDANMINDSSSVQFVMREPNWSSIYLTFEAFESGTFSFSNTSFYSIDGGSSWVQLLGGVKSPLILSGQKISFKQETSVSVKDRGCGTFSSTGKFKVYGNPLSMLFLDDFDGVMTLSGTSRQYALAYLFSGNTNVVAADKMSLPPKNLSAYYCYMSMFSDCTALETAPELPATSINNNCYTSMFKGCTSLNTAPSTLPSSGGNQSFCYSNMFSGCTSLEESPIINLSSKVPPYGCANMFRGCSNLHKITLLTNDISSNSNCLTNWVDGVAETGTFVKSASMTSLPTGVSGIPANWTVINA